MIISVKLVITLESVLHVQGLMNAYSKHSIGMRGRAMSFAAALKTMPTESGHFLCTEILACCLICITTAMDCHQPDMTCEEVRILRKSIKPYFCR